MYYLVRYPGAGKICYTPANRRTVKALINKGVIVSVLSDKEFAVQLALGTTDHRVYKLPGNCK